MRAPPLGPLPRPLPPERRSSRAEIPTWRGVAPSGTGDRDCRDVPRSESRRLAAGPARAAVSRSSRIARGGKGTDASMARKDRFGPEVLPVRDGEWATMTRFPRNARHAETIETAASGRRRGSRHCSNEGRGAPTYTETARRRRPFDLARPETGPGIPPRMKLPPVQRSLPNPRLGGNGGCGVGTVGAAQTEIHPVGPNAHGSGHGHRVQPR